LNINILCIAPAHGIKIFELFGFNFVTTFSCKSNDRKDQLFILTRYRKSKWSLQSFVLDPARRQRAITAFMFAFFYLM